MEYDSFTSCLASYGQGYRIKDIVCLIIALEL